MNIDKFIVWFNGKYDINETNLDDLRTWLIRNDFKNDNLDNLKEILIDYWEYESGPKHPQTRQINKIWNRYKWKYQEKKENWIQKCFRENDDLTAKEIVKKIQVIRDNKSERGFFFANELDFIHCYDPIDFCYEILQQRNLSESSIEKFIREIIENNLKTGKEINYNKIKGIKTPFTNIPDTRNRDLKKVDEVVKNFDEL